MKEKSKNIPPISISKHRHQNETNSKRPSHHIKLKPRSKKQAENNNNINNKSFPTGKEVFNDPYSLADEKYNLLVDISQLETEVEPMRSELIDLIQFVHRTQKHNEEVRISEQYESLGKEYDQLCIEYENLSDMYSEITLEKVKNNYKRIKKMRKVYIMKLDDAETNLLNKEAEVSDNNVADNEEVYNKNKKKIKALKEKKKKLENEENNLNLNLCEAFSMPPKQTKQQELNRLTKEYNALKVIELNKKHEFEFMERSHNARTSKIKQNIQSKQTNKNESKERKQFSNKWKEIREKKKKEEEEKSYFIFTSYNNEIDKNLRSQNKSINEPPQNLKENSSRRPRKINQINCNKYSKQGKNSSSSSGNNKEENQNDINESSEKLNKSELVNADDDENDENGCINSKLNENKRIDNEEKSQINSEDQKILKRSSSSTSSSSSNKNRNKENSNSEQNNEISTDNFESFEESPIGSPIVPSSEKRQQISADEYNSNNNNEEDEEGVPESCEDSFHRQNENNALNEGDGDNDDDNNNGNGTNDVSLKNRNDFNASRTMGSDDFADAIESNKQNKQKNQNEQNQPNFCRSLQSELGSDEDNNLGSTLDNTTNGIAAILMQKTSTNQNNDSDKIIKKSEKLCNDESNNKEDTNESNNQSSYHESENNNEDVNNENINQGKNKYKLKKSSTSSSSSDENEKSNPCNEKETDFFEINEENNETDEIVSQEMKNEGHEENNETDEIVSQEMKNESNEENDMIELGPSRKIPLSNLLSNMTDSMFDDTTDGK